MSVEVPSGRYDWALMMSPDHICDTPSWPAGMSLYIVMVTFGDVAATIALSCSPTTFRSASDEVFTSVMPWRRSTIDMAVCQSSMTAVLPLYCRIPQHVVGILHRGRRWSGTWSLRHPMPVV